jgi:hypothetical protein
MALFVWLVPIATIYPPGALTVTSRLYFEVKSLDVSIMNPPAPANFDVIDPDNTPFATLTNPYQRHSEEVDKTQIYYEYKYLHSSFCNIDIMLIY